MSKIANTKQGTVYPILDARTPMKGSNLLPVKLSVTLKGKQFMVGIKLYSVREVFEKAISSAGTVPREAKQLRANIQTYLDKAQTIIDSFPNIDKPTFTKLFKTEAELKVNDKTDITALFNQKISELAEADRAGSKSFYEAALSAFQRYKTELYLEDITEDWLKGFRSWWLSIGNAPATAQMHFRCLRHIFKRAIKSGIIHQSLYPFAEFTIGSSRKSKDVLYPHQLKALWEYKPTKNGEARSKDYFFFLYLGNGMNIKDALQLKAENIKGDTIVFVRSKTESTNHETKEIVVHLHPEMRRIIEKWGSVKPNEYLFPCMRGQKTNIERKRAKDILARNLNRDLKPIGEKLGFEVKLTLNLARHSYATRLKIDGIPTSMISDALGHSSSAVTEHYLKSIPNEMVQKISESLLNF